MSTVSRSLPAQPHLDVPKREARDLLKLWQAAQPAALERIRRQHPRFRAADDAAVASGTFRLADAQLVLAREYGFASWSALKQRIAVNATARTLDAAIRANDRARVRDLLLAQPALLHLPVRSGNWGPPMSHAANLGRLEIVQDIAALGARDFQHAFDRAVLQGKLDCARWLHAHGASLSPEFLLGPCETLNADGLRFLFDLGIPRAGTNASRLAPLAMVLETYGRHPAGKHACLDILAAHGYELPDTPMMAFHRGRSDLLERHLARDPSLLSRRFTSREIYPPELGCANDGRSGLHGTPLAGTTLLHLAIDFIEADILALLLARGADVDAPAVIDAEGFGGHTPLFHCVVCTPPTGASAVMLAFTRALLERGASVGARANLRKFLDWIEEPRWHEARDVTPAAWAEGFPERAWVNHDALPLLGGRFRTSTSS